MIRPTLTFLAAFTILTGLVYPLAMTGIGAALMPDRAAGSLILRDGAAIGSSLMGQQFVGAAYFHPRPSATDYAAGAGSNLGPTSAALRDAAAERRRVWEGENNTPAPIDAVTASASGLDPDISVENARGQAQRIADARGIAVADVLAVTAPKGRWLGLYGQSRVTVLQANLALDAAHPMPPAAP